MKNFRAAAEGKQTGQAAAMPMVLTVEFQVIHNSISKFSSSGCVDCGRSDCQRLGSPEMTEESHVLKVKLYITHTAKSGLEIVAKQASVN
jgi:hypothetical protein